MDMRIRFCLEAPVAHAAAVDIDVDGNDADPGVMLRDFLASNYVHLHRRLLRHLGCPDQASDCLHDAWLRLGEVCVSAAVQNPEAYIYRVACNAAIDHLRGYRALYGPCELGVDIEQIIDAAPGPDRVAEARSNLEAMMRTLQRLPRLHQAILVALRVEETPRQEVAARYGLSLRNVDTVLRKALERCGRLQL
jgi:RNA polymerase sigma factor (sigma-70 family)